MTLSCMPKSSVLQAVLDALRHYVHAVLSSLTQGQRQRAGPGGGGGGGGEGGLLLIL